MIVLYYILLYLANHYQLSSLNENLNVIQNTADIQEDFVNEVSREEWVMSIQSVINQMINFTTTFSFTQNPITSTNANDYNTVNEVVHMNSNHTQFSNQLSSYVNRLLHFSEQAILINQSSSSSSLPVIPEGLYNSLRDWISVTIPQITIQDFRSLLQALFSICNSI